MDHQDRSIPPPPLGPGPAFWEEVGAEVPHRRPVIIGHRGCPVAGPENTLASAAAAIGAGADMWECDVHLTRDGVPVVIHDETLLRTTDVDRRWPHDPRRGRGYRVGEFTLAEIRTLDAGSWYTAAPAQVERSAANLGVLDRLMPADRSWFASGSIRVPTLREALEWTGRQGTRLNIELKSIPSFPPDLARAVVGVVRELGMASRVLIASFHHGDLVAVRQMAPELATGCLISDGFLGAAEYARQRIGATALHPSAQLLGGESDRYLDHPAPDRLRLGLVRSAGQMGLRVVAWTINDHRRGGLADHVWASGVTAIITDDVPGLRKLFDF